MLAAVPQLIVLLASLAVEVEPEAQDRVNQYLTTERSSERASLLRSLQKENFAAIEEALRTGTTAPSQPERDSVIERTLKTDVGQREFETLIYLPRNYTPEKRYKLLVALHGTGGHGSQYVHVWLPWVRKREDIILAAPSIVGEPWGGSQTAHSHVHTLVSHVVKEFAIDHDRIYMGGMSMGGYAAFRIGCFRGDRYAGLICRVHGPIFQPPSGQSARNDGSNLEPRFLENLRNTPFYWIVGQTDPGISIDLMRRGHEKLKALEYDVTYREKPGGHEIYLEENDNILKWIDQHSRDPYPTQVEFHTNRPDYNRMNWVEITKFSGKPPASVKTLDFEGKPAGTRREYLQDAIVTAQVDRGGNSITIQSQRVQQLAVYLSDKMLNLDAPVRIVVNGRTLWQKPVRRSLQVLLEDARLRSDRSMVFSARVVLNVP